MLFGLKGSMGKIKKKITEVSSGQTKPCSEPCHASKIEIFSKIIKGFDDSWGINVVVSVLGSLFGDQGNVVKKYNVSTWDPYNKNDLM